MVVWYTLNYQKMGVLLFCRRNDDPPRFNVYFETVDMADTLIMLRQARYPAANNQTIRFLQVPRNSETMSHAKAMKTPYVPPKCIDPEKNKNLRCNFDVRRGYQDGYRKTMSNIQDVRVPDVERRVKIIYYPFAPLLFLLSEWFFFNLVL